MRNVKRTQDQAAVIRKARKALGITNRQLAAKLDYSLKTVQAWLLPEGNKARRNMPAESREKLAELVKAKR